MDRQDVALLCGYKEVAQIVDVDGDRGQLLGEDTLVLAFLPLAALEEGDRFVMGNEYGGVLFVEVYNVVVGPHRLEGS